MLRGAVPAPEEEDFNRFDAALCDVPLGDFWFAVLAVLRAPVFEAFADFAALGRLGEVLGDFLRDFLDIRLPFVAFGSSIMGLLRVFSGKPDSRPRLGKSDGLGLWLQGFRRTACLLVE
jgi:hypothetical protein